MAGFSGSWGSACGHPVEPGTRFCPVCGQPTGAVEITSESSDGIDLNTGTYGKVQAPLLPPLPGTGEQPTGTGQPAPGTPPSGAGAQRPWSASGPAPAPTDSPRQESARYPSDPRQAPGTQPVVNPFQQPDGSAPTTVQRAVAAPGSPAAPAPTTVQRTMPAPSAYGSQPGAAPAGPPPGYGQTGYGQPGPGQTPPPYGQPGSDPKLPYSGQQPAPQQAGFQQPGPGSLPPYGVPPQPYAAPPSWPQTSPPPQAPGFQPPAGPGWGPPGNGNLPAAPGAPAYAPGNPWAGPAAGGWPGQQGPSQPAGRQGGIFAAIVRRLRGRRNGNQRLSAGV